MTGVVPSCMYEMVWLTSGIRNKALMFWLYGGGARGVARQAECMPSICFQARWLGLHELLMCREVQSWCWDSCCGHQRTLAGWPRSRDVWLHGRLLVDWQSGLPDCMPHNACRGA